MENLCLSHLSTQVKDLPVYRSYWSYTTYKSYKSYKTYFINCLLTLSLPLCYIASQGGSMSNQEKIQEALIEFRARTAFLGHGTNRLQADKAFLELATELVAEVEKEGWEVVNTSRLFKLE